MRARPGRRPLASSINRFASIISPLVVSQILAVGGGVSWVFGSFLIVAVLGLAVLAGMGIETRKRTLEELAC